MRGFIKCRIKYFNINLCLLSQSVRNSYLFAYVGAINFTLKCTGTLFHTNEVIIDWPRKWTPECSFKLHSLGN